MRAYLLSFTIARAELARAELARTNALPPCSAVVLCVSVCVCVCVRVRVCRAVSRKFLHCASHCASHAQPRTEMTTAARPCSSAVALCPPCVTCRHQREHHHHRQRKYIGSFTEQNVRTEKSAKSEQDKNSKVVALVFSLLQTDEIPVNFC